MANAGNIFKGISQGFSGISQTLQSADKMRQEAEQRKAQKEAAELQRAGMRFNIWLKSNPSYQRKVAKTEAFQKDFFLVSGTEATPEHIDLLMDKDVKESLLKLDKYKELIYQDPKYRKEFRDALGGLNLDPLGKKRVLDGFEKRLGDYVKTRTAIDKVSNIGQYYKTLGKQAEVKSEEKIPAGVKQLNTEKQDISRQLSSVLTTVKGLKGIDEDDPQIKTLTGRANMLGNLWNAKNNQINKALGRGVNRPKEVPKMSVEEIAADANEAPPTASIPQPSQKQQKIPVNEAAERLGRMIDLDAVRLAKELGVEKIDGRLKDQLVMDELKRQGY